MKPPKLPSKNLAPPVIHPVDAGRAIMEVLARKFTPDDLMRRLEEGLDAMTPPISTKDGNIVTRPDFPTRHRYIETILAYLVGRPVERQEIISRSAPATLDDLLAKARSSSVFREAMLNVLRRLETEGG